MTNRLSKIALVAAVGLFLLLVVFNNLSDYGSNLAFVRHVLAMDTTFEGNGGMWRAIGSPVVHHAFYWMIILWEAAAMVGCFAGARRLWVARRGPAAAFNRAKAMATLGLVAGMLLWFVAFLTVGGEWFLMWQSESWNGQDAAFRMFACLGLVLVFLAQEDRELDA